MDRLAVELLEQIFLLACTDGGFTGASLSRVSKHIRAVSRAARFHTIALLSPFPGKLEQFASCYVQERALSLGATPKVRHLLVASAIRQTDSARVVLKPSPDGDASKYLPDVNDVKKQREASQRELRKFHMDVAALLQLLAPDLLSLTLVHCHRYGKPEMRFPDTIEVPGGFPLLQELTIAGIQPRFTSPECPSGSLYPSLERLHLSLVALSGCPDLNIVAWGDNAPKLAHLRISNVNYWPRTIMDSVRKVFGESSHSSLSRARAHQHARFSRRIRALERVAATGHRPAAFTPAHGRPLRDTPLRLYELHRESPGGVQALLQPEATDNAPAPQSEHARARLAGSHAQPVDRPIIRRPWMLGYHERAAVAVRLEYSSGWDFPLCSIYCPLVRSRSRCVRLVYEVSSIGLVDIMPHPISEVSVP